MKQKLLCLAMLCLPATIFCQQRETVNGIRWAQDLSWQQVKEKAKKENKYIFVDCYATWCKPCKEMDQRVYTVDSVGNFLNAGFISVKLQMDQTKNDDAFIKSWYKTAREIASKYWISAYPSYVFFAPNGDVVSKETGYKDPGSFIQVARNAKNPSKQYFVLLKNYKKGKLDDAATRSLINTAKKLNDSVNYRELQSSYFSRLHALPKEKLYTKENIEFVSSTLDRSKMILFDMFYPDGTEVNRVMQSKWYARSIVDNLIWKEKVDPFLKTAEGKPEPDWNILFKDIAKDYKRDYADRVVLYAKQTWYSQHGDFLNEARCFNDGVEKYGTDTTDLGEDFKLIFKAERLFFLNVTDAKELQRAIIWLEGVVRRGQNLTSDYVNQWHTYMDTYANLLYKAGRTADALKWEELAITTLKETTQDPETVAIYAKAYGKVIEKIKAGKPTWPIPK
jgi:thioredoxin-related protein